MPTWFSFTFFGLAPRVSDLSIYLRNFCDFRLGCRHRAGSLGSPPIGIRSSEALGSSFPGSTNLRPARMGVSLFDARRLYLDDGISLDFPSTYLMHGFLRFLRFPSSMLCTRCHAYASYEVVDLSPSPLRRWLTSCGSFGGPVRLRGGAFCSPPTVSFLPGESVFWVEFLKYFASTFLGFWHHGGISSTYQQIRMTREIKFHT